MLVTLRCAFYVSKIGFPKLYFCSVKGRNCIVAEFSPLCLAILFWHPASMEANRGQNGIQLLLAAEQEAQHIVNAARNAKMARLKQSKEEAEKEIAEFRAQMEANFQRKLAESSGDSGANVKRLEQETDAKIQHLRTQAASISPEVVQMLLKYVTAVKN
ncbi:V-type proton ATPase subunit G 1 [Ancistrocladus abbreviatus]